MVYGFEKYSKKIYVEGPSKNIKNIFKKLKNIDKSPIVGP